jgi:hypothetical protein
LLTVGARRTLALGRVAHALRVSTFTAPAMSITAGHVTAFFLFDVAEGVSLDALPTMLGPAERARLAPKPATPSYVQYQTPPLSFDAEAVGLAPVENYRTRVKVFDYGVVSVALSHPFAGTWTEFVTLGQRVIDNAALERAAEGVCRQLLDRMRGTLSKPRSTFLAEDYVVFAVTCLSEPLPADTLAERHGTEIAQLLRAEKQPLSRQERDEILRHRLSYLADDLVVPTWNAALVYDTEAGAQAALEILEYANSQLLEFRYYDDTLDAELARIYKDLQKPRISLWGAGRQTRAAHQVQSLLVELHELTDHTENALKFVGDVYAARLFALAATRLGLDRWKASVQEKLKTLDDIYRFAVEQTAMARGEFLELTIVLILVLELVLFFLGIMR